MVGMKKQTKTAREFKPGTCVSCSEPYNAPVKIRGGGVIGEGRCPNCIRAARPARKSNCPVCGDEFKIQQGHKRDTCHRECQRIFTLRRRASDTMNVAEAVRIKAQEEADSLYTALMDRRKADEAAKQAEAAVIANRKAEEEREREEARRKEAEAGAMVTRAFRDGDGDRMQRITRVAETIRHEREAVAS